MQTPICKTQTMRETRGGGAARTPLFVRRRGQARPGPGPDPHLAHVLQALEHGEVVGPAVLGAEPHHVLPAHRLLRQLPPATRPAAAGTPRDCRARPCLLPRPSQGTAGTGKASSRAGHRRPRRQRQQQEQSRARAAAPDTSARRHLGSATSGVRPPTPRHARRMQISATVTSPQQDPPLPW